MTTKLLCTCSLALLLAAGCSRAPDMSEGGKKTLADGRRDFATKLLRREKTREPAPLPPPTLLRLAQYPSPAGPMAAYISTPPRDAQKHPAIMWIFGGFDNSINETAWEPGPPEDDQSASAFREAGIIMMYPSLRGGNMNPGFREGLFGEVDDILAAADFLKRQPGVDPERIYLGGHSTGGTLVLLAAEHPNDFRAVFALGAVSNVRGYGQENLPFDLTRREEIDLRSPVKWLAAVRTPTYVFEGAGRDSNIGELRIMSRANRNPLIRFHPVKGGDHFSIIRPITRLVAAKILADEGATSNITFSAADLAKAMQN
jgi:hypothetical protein